MSTEMKKLIIGGTEYEIVDDAGRTRITALEQGGGGSGTGLTQTEKNLLLSLFEKAAYAEDDAGTAYTALSNLWTGYSITWSGTGYTKSNSAIAVNAGASFTSTVTANTGFTLTDVAVTMGGNTVQGAWSNGTVTIPNVTGDIVITVTTSQITVSSISAVYTQSGTVYDTDTLDSLKSDLVVTATFMDSTTGVIAASDYTLSGTLTAGTSTVTVTYASKTTTFTVTVTQGPLYPLTTGEKIWTDADRKVSVSDGNIVKGELRSGGSSDMHANISWLSLNGAVNDTNNNKVGTSKLFTIPSGSLVTIKVTPLTVEYENAQIGGRSTNIAMRDSTGTNLHTLLNTTAYNTLTVGTPVTDSFTASTDLDIWNITMWMQAYSGNKTCTLELEIELTVDGVRFI